MPLTNYSFPIGITITVPVDVASFGGTSVIASALSKVENARRRFDVLPLQFVFERGRSYRLRYFRVNSPPEASTLSDPAWLAVYLALLAVGVQVVGTYPQLKSGARDIFRDVTSVKNAAIREMESLVHQISGLSDARLLDLQQGAQLYLEHVLKLGPEQVIAFLEMAGRFAHMLGARRGKRPSVQIDNNDRNVG